MLDTEACWEAVRRRDASQAGQFYFGVTTTGIYCSPHCSSREPLRKNVRFYESALDAERDGLRPCKRCRPLETRDLVAERMHAICRFIEAHSDDPLHLETLAQQAGMSRFHFQRTFKAVVGITPKQYHDGLRVNALKSALETSGDIADAAFDAGYGSTSRVYERAAARLGMTPAQYRRAGHGITIYFACMETPVGLLMLGATDRGLCFVQFGETEVELEALLRAEFERADIRPMQEPRDPQFDAWTDALRAHLSGAQPHVDLPTDIRATAFQQRVWTYLQRIPYGEVRSYAEVARGIGQPAAARAVARACASNPLAIVIPCHRVIRGSGQLSGYKWGVERKRALLDRESALRRVDFRELGAE
ncbi:MAG TPA: bifunctional DNA-binding transcriptional regulator/O6-methylguanine-DNA methyltransferase Ada [Candidatus Dormibacteraeota bacterium]|nr:bifunctional DNA-binding transcriptional regulator/O6-methylguanine-DNA methyltransferase Ada [Candidatus Dormibacteraeota bacterium]